mmetsp:Transcript_5428/g.9442  ORF Transcript_5428/g.9442 Transcript_5428/m.9442 type:complete len:200 (+) Transcript_5428:13-612(+)
MVAMLRYVSPTDMGVQSSSQRNHVENYLVQQPGYQESSHSRHVCRQEDPSQWHIHTSLDVTLYHKIPPMAPKVRRRRRSRQRTSKNFNRAQSCSRGHQEAHSARSKVQFDTSRSSHQEIVQQMTPMEHGCEVDEALTVSWAWKGRVVVGPQGTKECHGQHELEPHLVCAPQEFSFGHWNWSTRLFVSTERNYGTIVRTK